MAKKQLRTRQMNQDLKSLVEKGYVNPCYKCGEKKLEYVTYDDGDMAVRCPKCKHLHKMIFADKTIPLEKKKFALLKSWEALGKIIDDKKVSEKKPVSSQKPVSKPAQKPVAKKVVDSVTKKAVAKKPVSSKKPTPVMVDREAMKSKKNCKHCSCKNRPCKKDVRPVQNQKATILKTDIMDLYKLFKLKREEKRKHDNHVSPEVRRFIISVVANVKTDLNKEMQDFIKETNDVNRCFYTQIKDLFDQFVKEVNRSRRDPRHMFKKSYHD